MVAPLIAAAARAGGTAAARKVAARTTITRTRTAEARVVQNARAAKKPADLVQQGPGAGPVSNSAQGAKSSNPGSNYVKGLQAGYRTYAGSNPEAANDNQLVADSRSEKGIQPALTRRNNTESKNSIPSPLRQSLAQSKGSINRPMNGLSGRLSAVGREIDSQQEKDNQQATEENQPDNEQARARQRDQNRARQLRQQRSRKMPISGGKLDQIKSAGKLGAIFFLYVPALLIALLKDLLDFIFIGSLPGLGTVVTLICSIGILLFLLIPQIFSQKKVGPLRVLRSLGLVMLATLAEFFPGLNFFPIETGAVLLVFVIDNKELFLRAAPIPKPIRAVSRLGR